MTLMRSNWFATSGGNNMTDTNQTDSPARSAGKTGPPILLNLTLDSASVARLLDLFRETLETTLAQALAKAEAPPEARPEPEPVEPPSSPKSTGLDLKAAD